MKKSIILLSGGLDSVVMLYSTHADAEFEIELCVSFDYGSKHNEKEIKYAKLHCDRLDIAHEVINLKFMAKLFDSSLLQGGEDVPEGHYEDSTMKSTVVPFRNGIMLSIAVGIAENNGYSNVLIAAHSGDHAIYPDCRTSFIENFSKASSSGTYNKVTIVAPFVNMDKDKIVSIGKKLDVDMELTWSCYKGNEFHCGKCGTCVERKEAFQNTGIEDPTNYE